MAQQTINVGAAPNDGTGTPLRTAFQYTNSNFTELYTALGGGSGLPGASGQLIFNNGTSLAGDNELFYNATTNTLTTEKLIVPGNTQVAGSASNLYVGSILNPTLFVNTNTNRVGIGTATPARPLDIVGSFQSSLGWVLTGTPAGLGAATRYIGGASTTDSWYYNAVTGGSHLWAFGESQAMRLDSNGLGVGVSPSYNIHARGTTNGRIQVEGASGFGMVFIQGSSGNTAQLQLNSSGGTGRRFNLYSDPTGFFGISDETAVATRLTIDSTGNVISNVTGTAPTLATNSQMVFNLTSNTNLRISVRGTDGTTRTANITLA